MAQYIPDHTKAPKKGILSFIPRAVKSKYINEKRTEWGVLISRSGLALTIVLIILFVLGKGLWIAGDAAEKGMYHNKIAKNAIEKIHWSARSITFIRQVYYSEVLSLSPEVIESANSWCHSTNGFMAGEYRIRGVSGAPNGETDLVVWVATPSFIQAYCGMVIWADGWKQYCQDMKEAKKSIEETSRQLLQYQ